MDFLKLIRIKAPASLKMSIACQRFRLFDKRPIMYALMLIGKYNLKCTFSETISISKLMVFLYS